MPGRLKTDAVCPVCGIALVALSDLTTAQTVTREYFHEKKPDQARRRPPCRRLFTDRKKAAQQRKELES